ELEAVADRQEAAGGNEAVVGERRAAQAHHDVLGRGRDRVAREPEGRRHAHVVRDRLRPALQTRVLEIEPVDAGGAAGRHEPGWDAGAYRARPLAIVAATGPLYRRRVGRTGRVPQVEVAFAAHRGDLEETVAVDVADRWDGDVPAVGELRPA